MVAITSPSASTSSRVRESAAACRHWPDTAHAVGIGVDEARAGDRTRLDDADVGNGGVLADGDRDRRGGVRREDPARRQSRRVDSRGVRARRKVRDRVRAVGSDRRTRATSSPSASVTITATSPSWPSSSRSLMPSASLSTNTSPEIEPGALMPWSSPVIVLPGVTVGRERLEGRDLVARGQARWVDLDGVVTDVEIVEGGSHHCRSWSCGRPRRHLHRAGSP